MEKSGIKKILNWQRILAGLLLVHVILLINLKFTAWSEMQLWPYLILKGWLPYRDIAIVHNPALLADLTIFNSIFGLGIWQLKIYTWLTILSIDALLFWIVKKFWNIKAAFYALALFIPLQLYYEGNGLWFDLSLTFVALLVYFFVMKKDYFKAGLFWALAFLVKQTAFWFLIPIGIYALQGGVLKASLKSFFIGLFLVFVPTFTIMWVLGILPDYLFWAYKFGLGVLPRASGQISFPDIKTAISALIPLLILSFLAIDYERKRMGGLLAWVLVGFMGAFPRWELFHFQPAVPFLAIFAALIFSNLGKNGYSAKFFLALYLLVNTVIIGRFLLGDWGREVRFLDAATLKVASYVRENTDKGDEIYVLNYWDNIYPLTDRLPATKPWIPHLAWYMDMPGVQQRLVDNLAKEPAGLIVFRQYTEAGLSSYKPSLIDDFIRNNYDVSYKIDDINFLKPK